MHSSTPLWASLICCLVFLLDLLIKDLERGFANVCCCCWLPLSDDDVVVVFVVDCLSFSGCGLAALLPPLLADTYALERRFKPVPSSESRGTILDNVKKLRNISLILISSFAEHSSTFTLQQKIEKKKEEIKGKYSMKTKKNAYNKNKKRKRKERGKGM